MTEPWNENAKVPIRWLPACIVGCGLWECGSCGSRFYRGGVAVHEAGCAVQGETGCVFLFGDKAIQQPNGASLPGDVSIERLIACRGAAIAANATSNSHKESVPMSDDEPELTVVDDNDLRPVSDKRLAEIMALPAEAMDTFDIPALDAAFFAKAKVQGPVKRDRPRPATDNPLK